MATEMQPLYDPAGVEPRWQRSWEEERLYAAGAGRRRDETYVIALPPPNVTGELHMGHALNAAFQDVLVRWHRMRGYDTLWQPGYDHAGIATQNVIERQLADEGSSRHELGRDLFLERTWAWLREYGGIIFGQLRRLGASLDYGRERFTMDDDYVQAVLTFFVHLHERGWLFRDNRIGNWCPRCHSAISDLEVDHIDVDDTLTSVRYPLADGDGYVTVATVRPPTMLADVAVAVSPHDERYAGLVGRDVIVPIAERRVPVITDERVDPGFGTGALKITPGHDPVDFEIARDHGLEALSVIALDGTMSDAAGDLAGLEQDEAERRIVELLRERELLEKREHYRHAVGHCNRCGSRVEPLITLQWWCDMRELAAPAIEAVRSGRVRLAPSRFARVYLDWLEGIRPWCISRQLWWGHRIPVWYCPDGHATVAVAEPETCATCGSADLTQDEDVLDTWFSSALWPFATLGWPERTPELERYYPNNVNVTGRDIIFLWEARMQMSGLELMGQIPFSDVVINATVLAPDGRRMSKSLGTGIDPLGMVDAHGADATRYGLLKMSSTQDVRFSHVAIDEGRKLANKLWNVARLILSACEHVTPSLEPHALEERWICARLDAARGELEDAWAAYDFAAATGVLYHLTFDDFCDWYAEAAKHRLYAGDRDAQATALAALQRLCLLLHPVMPHVTEEIWSHLPNRKARLIVSPWPEPDDRFAADLHALDRVQEAAQVYRRSGVEVELGSEEEERVFRSVVRPGRAVVTTDVETERERLRQEISRAEAMLANEKFVARAPQHVVDGEREKLERYRNELSMLGSE
jgi:valyl-tRNA synthetase